MYIKLTKRFANELGIRVSSCNDNTPFFSWHATFFMINHRKTIILMNDATKMCVILHGIRKNNYKHFESLITQSIQEMLTAVNIDKALIDSYIANAGSISFTKSDDASVLSSMSQIKSRILSMIQLYNDPSLNQLRAAKDLSRFVFKASSHTTPIALLLIYIDRMEKGEDLSAGKVLPFSQKAFQFLIRLCCNDDGFNINRTVIVPANITFLKLHRIIQTLFAWQNYHLHDFKVYDKETADGVPIAEFREEYDDEFIYLHDNDIGFFDVLNPEQMKRMKHPPRYKETTRLEKYIPAHTLIAYTYDYGDDWIHRITLEKVIDDYAFTYPTCIRGEGDPPPEDSGGIGGYAHILQVLSNPKHREYRETASWVRLEEFNIDAINKKLRKL
ncbi:MAG: plasmid pRiA4b ORF-3 family protein [Spirochaetaceae bacterium]|jgi:hypothetical protein|nr:plasmid pRiA4b ORF-3 family protein [Spirochaetaceae bacterium]